MKIKTKLSALFLVIISAFACEDLDEITEFNITEDFSTAFNISLLENEDGMGETFEKSTTIDLTTNVDIQSNIDLMQGVSINSLTYEIDNFSGVEGAKITEASLNFGSTSILISDIDLYQSDLDNSIYTINDINVLNSIANALLSNSVITASIVGSVDTTPVRFDVKISLDVTVTIDVI